jgi:endonuclease/exonuclease/phosphatase family metal-dependent hydrolase
MPPLRVAAFNVENLFARWRFREGVDPRRAIEEGWLVDAALVDRLGDEDKAITAEAIRALDADVLCLVEVEGVDTLKHFRDRMLGGREAYPYVAGIDGNDERLIDVAVLSRVPIVHVRTHQHLLDPAEPRAFLFKRDCLEVDVVARGARPLTLYVNHFKSMAGGREATSAVRRRQAQGVLDIVRGRFGERPGDAAFLVAGDLNDFRDPVCGILDLIDWDEVEDVLGRLPEHERWTHYYAREESYHQLDYVLVSRSLAQASPALPQVMRRGMPRRAARYSGERFAGVGHDRPKASDHCPIVVDLEVPAA